MRNTKGKTYEEIYGPKKAKELKEFRRKNAVSQMKVQRKGKTREEIFGKEKADELKNIFSKKFSGKGNPNYQGGKIIINCENCNKVFKVYKVFKDIRKRCSQECHNIVMENQVEFTCKICNKESSRKESWGESKYCSMKCRNLDYKGENNPNWKNGISFEPYSTDWTKELRLYIRTRDNFTCQLCDMTEVESLVEMGRVLAVHHIDYNKQNCDKSNLITVCSKCNSKVNGNRDYWINYFSKELELV